MKNKILVGVTKKTHEKLWKDEFYVYNYLLKKKIKRELMIDDSLVQLFDEVNENTQQTLLAEKESEVIDFVSRLSWLS